jgi:hypothetical protein
MALQTMCGTMQSLATIAPLHTSAGGLIEALQGGGCADDIVPILEDLMSKLLPQAKSMRSVLERVTYPYEHAKGRMSLAQFVMPDVPTKGDLASIFNGCGQVLETGPALYVRLLGEMVWLTDSVETACGLPTLTGPAAPVNA